MLLEETARTCLGDEGDLVFIEPEESEEDKVEEQLQKESSRRKSRSAKREVERGYEGYEDDDDE